jgi:hypothetical protein
LWRIRTPVAAGSCCTGAQRWRPLSLSWGAATRSASGSAAQVLAAQCCTERPAACCSGCIAQLCGCLPAALGVPPAAQCMMHRRLPPVVSRSRGHIFESVNTRCKSHPREGPCRRWSRLALPAPLTTPVTTPSTTSIEHLSTPSPAPWTTPLSRVHFVGRNFGNITP